MSRVPIGCVSRIELAAEAGITSQTAGKYLKEMGITGYISIGRRQEVIGKLKEKLFAARHNKEKLSRQEIADAAGCSKPTAVRILSRLGWPTDIPRERLKDAVSAIKEERAAGRERQRDVSRKNMEAARNARKRKSAHPVLRKLIQRTVQEKKPSSVKPESRPASLPKPAEEKSRPLLEESRLCDWRVSMLGSKGWLVVRCGTQDEMEAWARMLRDNGFTAEAAQNEYKSG